MAPCRGWWWAPGQRRTCMLDVERAIPCGLLVNELVTNALKHACQ